MNSAYIIKKAILSEKAYKLMEKGIYTFLVDRASQKNEIAKAVEKQFSVKVEKVNVLEKKPKQKRIPQTRKTVTAGGGKKALVYLKPGETISLLSPKTEAKKEQKKENVKAVKKEDKK